jgi:hypothetical protein
MYESKKRVLNQKLLKHEDYSQKPKCINTDFIAIVRKFRNGTTIGINWEGHR